MSLQFPFFYSSFKGCEIAAGDSSAESALWESESTAKLLSDEILKKIYEGHFDAIFILENDSDRTIVDCNPAATDMFGFKKEELIGRSIRIVHADDKTYEIFQKTLFSEVENRGVAHIDKYIVKKRDGSSFYSKHSVMPLFGDDGEGIGWVSMVRDITESVEAENNIIKANERLRLLNSRMQRIREEEREYLSNHLMDEMAQDWTGLSFKVAKLEKKLQQESSFEGREEVARQLSEMGVTIKTLIQKGRDLASSIRPSILDTLGFSAALIWLAEDFQKKNEIICITRGIGECTNLGKRQAGRLYRICEEILDNVRDHSRAGSVDFILTEIEGRLNLQIFDDGIGMTRENITDPASLGILKMREDVKVLGGVISFKGRKNRGTRISISLPIRRKA